MRILIRNGKHKIIKEVPEVRITSSGNIGVPKLRKQYLTGEKTEELFKNLLANGYADLSEFDCENYISEIPL